MAAIPPELEALLKSGAVLPEVADIIRSSMDKDVKPGGEPLPEDELMAMASVGPADIARALADWQATVEPWAADLLDAAQE